MKDGEKIAVLWYHVSRGKSKERKEIVLEDEDGNEIVEDEVAEDPNHPVAHKKLVPDRYLETFAGEVLGSFYNRLVHLTTSYSLMGYHQSPVPEVMNHIALVKVKNKERSMINQLILKLCRQVKETKEEQDEADANTIAIWWSECYAFHRKTGVFSDKLMWADKRRFTEPHVWYRVWILPITKFFGLTGMKTLSKPCGMTGCERNWRDNKLNCSGLRAKLSPQQNSKLTTIQGSYQVSKARLAGDSQASAVLLCAVLFVQ